MTIARDVESYGIKLLTVLLNEEESSSFRLVLLLIFTASHNVTHTKFNGLAPSLKLYQI